MTRTHEIRLTELDAVRLERALMQILKTSALEPQGAAELEILLDTAAIVPSASIDPEVVTMNSTVVLESRPAGERTTLTLVYPKDVDPDQSRVSVLSPIGCALLGHGVGAVVDVELPNGSSMQVRLDEVEEIPDHQ